MRQGFSLLELSIVLVIIGLITGGIMAGRSMVRVAEMRSLISDIQKYQSAINIFREKYNAYPGDMKNATSYWGIAAAGAACATTVGTGTQTCDGNGDGWVQHANTGSTQEGFRFWQQLANAGLIEGQYTGVTGSGGTYNSVIGSNVPASKITNVGYSVWSGTYAGDPNKFALSAPTQLFYVGGQTTSFAEAPMFTTTESYGIDMKLDDGMPGTGTVMANYRNSCTNSASATDFTSTYLLSSSGLLCSLWVKF